VLRSAFSPREFHDRRIDLDPKRFFGGNPVVVFCIQDKEVLVRLFCVDDKGSSASFPREIGGGGPITRRKREAI
jgi:hypothetical protein